MNSIPRNQFKTILTFLVPQVIKIITEETKVSEDRAVRTFYKSKVYTFLEREETKVWHFSALTLYTMYRQEMETGTIEFPEEC
jgi:hypothetical protein